MNHSNTRANRSRRRSKPAVKVSFNGVPAIVNPDSIRNWSTAHGTSLVDGSKANSIKYGHVGDSMILRLNGQRFSATKTDLDVFCQDYLSSRGLTITAPNGTTITDKN